MTYTCPVCGYNKLTSPPADYSICKCCGTEFGYDDFARSHTDLRKQWISEGMQWHSRRVEPPVGWNPVAQLLSAGFGYELRATGKTTVKRAYASGGGVGNSSAYGMELGTSSQSHEARDFHYAASS